MIIIIIIFVKLKLCTILNMNNFYNCKLISLFRVPLSLEVKIRSGQPKKLYFISFLFAFSAANELALRPT